MTDLPRYLADSSTRTSQWWLYRFPNGQTASVIPDQRMAFRFELLIDVDSRPMPGLTTAEVEAKLTELANQPADN